jgi:hypothetical protein
LSAFDQNHHQNSVTDIYLILENQIRFEEYK